jgi:hypothetical protein
MSWTLTTLRKKCEPNGRSVKRKLKYLRCQGVLAFIVLWRLYALISSWMSCLCRCGLWQKCPKEKTEFIMR